MTSLVVMPLSPELKRAVSRQAPGRVHLVEGGTTDMVLTSLNGSGLHGKARSSKICRCLGQPDDSREAVRVVGHGDGEEAQGTGLAGRGRQSDRAGTRPGLLHPDTAEGWHAILHVEQATGRGTDAGAWLPKTRPAGGQSP